MFKKLFLIICIILSFFGTAHAAKRIGLVIGNDTYTHVPVLQKARNDARAISDALTGVGFEITRVLDADRREMNRAISTFMGKLQPGDTAIVYFAGHGVEIDGENYLLPTNIESPENASEDFIKSESIGLSNVLSRVQSTGARTTLMFIDACRDNPFGSAGGRSIGGTRGLARITAPEGTFVVFSAGARQQALDRLSGVDSDPNSVFTRTLLPKLTDPNLELRQLVSNVRVEVRDLALKQNHRQFPAYYDELLGEFYFNPIGIKSAPKPKQTAEIAPATGADNALQADFERVRSMNSVVAYEAFLEKYKGKSDLLIDIASRQLEELQTQVATIKPAPPVEQPPEKPVGMSRREIIRISQKRLNELGCAVGVADGVAGPRTHRAFREYLSVSGVDLRPSDLGGEIALDHLNSAKGIICEEIVREPPPEKIIERAQPERRVALVEPREPPGYSLAGYWSLKAKCPLAIVATGSTTYRSLGGNRYAAETRDNFGNVGKGTVTDQGGGALAAHFVWQDGANDIYTARLSPDRRTITGTNYLGCRFTARKED